MIRDTDRYDIYPRVANVISWKDRFGVVSFVKPIAIETPGYDLYEYMSQTNVARGSYTATH